MNSFFWKNQPLDVRDTQQNLFRPIKTVEELLGETQERLRNYDINLDYSVLSFRNLPEDKKDSIVKFINSNYITSSDKTFQLQYDKQLIYFFCQSDSIVVEFVAKKTDRVVGYFIGCPHTLVLHSKYINCFEANFLCLLPQLRKLGIAPFMMDTLMYEALMRLNINVYNYTIQTKIKAEFYCQKATIHRYINIDALVAVGQIVTNKYTKRVYENFSVLEELKEKYDVINVDDSDDELYRKYATFYRGKYQVYSLLSERTFKEMIQNTSFLKYGVKNKTTGAIDGLFIFYKTTLVNVVSETTARNGTLYLSFWDNFGEMFDLVMKSVYEDDVVDQILFQDMNCNPSRCVEGDGYLRYYMHNLPMLSIPKHKNALVTL